MFVCYIGGRIYFSLKELTGKGRRQEGEGGRLALLLTNEKAKAPSWLESPSRVRPVYVMFKRTFISHFLPDF
jgi:hypothetical protein